MEPTCYWPLTRCPDCGETYCEKCDDPHICELIETSQEDFAVIDGSVIQTAKKEREAIRDTP